MHEESLEFAVFLHRIGAARVLREHQFWDAVRMIRDEARHGETGEQLQELVDELALVDAVLHLGRVMQPPVRIEVIRKLEGGWSCQVTVDGYPRRFCGQHADLAAALLTALVRSAMLRRAASSTTQVVGATSQRRTRP